MNKYFSILFLSFCFFFGCGPSTDVLNQETLKVIKQTQMTLENNFSVYKKESKTLNRFMDDAFLNDPIKILPYKKKADSISSRTNDLLTQIDRIKKSKTKISVSELNSELNKYREFIFSSLSRKDKQYFLFDTLFVDSFDELSLLIIQNQILNMKIDAGHALYRHIDMEYFRFDTMAVRIIPESKIVRVGDDYKADIFLSPFSYTSNPVILIGEHDTVPVRKGVGYYTTIPKKIGKFELKGIVKSKDPADPTHYYNFPFSIKYEVVK